MPDPARGFFVPSRQSSFLKRIRENFESIWTLPHPALAGPRAANCAPIHLLDQRGERANPMAQAGSTCLHLLIFVLLLYPLVHPSVKTKSENGAASVPVDTLKFSAPKRIRNAANASLGKRGGGGDENPIPATGGDLATHSGLVLESPRLPDGRLRPLLVPVTVFDTEAPEFAQPVKELGLPWMGDRNNSAGSGKNGIGTGPGAGMGNGPGDGAGQADDARPYANVAAQVVCKYCPDPVYSDEARKAKLQGQVTMRVLVGADGRVRDVQVTHGIGLGLDENAMHEVRNWQFIPAKDAARRPVATWITIETLFRLF